MKINPTDLRIGNLLQDGVTKTLLKVIELTEKDVVTYVIDRSKFPLEKGWFIDPIPLTEEWLLNLGFEKHPDYFCKEIKPCKTFILAKESDDDVYFLCDCDVDTDLKYVHQLQNIYFALTNTELILKP